MRFHLETESGSHYIIDTTEQTMTRLPSGEGSTLEGDFTPVKYQAMWKPPKVGEPLCVFWEEAGGWPQLRSTTRVVKLEESE